MGILRTKLWTTITSWALISTLAQAQLYPDPSRNCSANETDIGPDEIPRGPMNATGAFEFPGFRDPNSNEPIKQWRWTAGVQNSYNFTNNLTFTYQQAVWLDTHGTDLAADDLDYEMCYITMWEFPSDVQKRGQGDNGDCTKFLSPQCVEDWKKALVDSGLRQAKSNSTDRKKPCDDLSSFKPSSCENFEGAARGWGTIPPQNRSCPFGLGSPIYDRVTFTSSFAYNAAVKNDTTDFSMYDKVVTSIKPVMAIAWSRTAAVQWSDARVMCMSTRQVDSGSRKPPRVPSSSSRIASDSFLVLGSIMLMMLF